MICFLCAFFIRAHNVIPRMIIKIFIHVSIQIIFIFLRQSIANQKQRWTGKYSCFLIQRMHTETPGLICVLIYNTITIFIDSQPFGKIRNIVPGIIIENTIPQSTFPQRIYRKFCHKIIKMLSIDFWTLRRHIQ